ncbi:MAG: acyltransferase family protein [Succinivibrio sp.]
MSTDYQIYIRSINMQKKYRIDIDILKGIAITSVVLYHFFSLLNSSYITDIHIFDGGFLGVDVFFVISGFLVSKGINKQYSQNTFHLIGFYQKRVARILPPFLIVCICTLFLGYFLVFPEVYKELSKEIINSLLFKVNMYFAHNGGYFSLSSSDKLLLHIWYISILIQFYLLYPLIYILIGKCLGGGANKTKITISILTVVLFALAVVLQNKNSSYLLTQTRIWELFFGACLSFYTTSPFISKLLTGKNGPIIQKFLFTLGLCLILVSIFTTELINGQWLVSTSLPAVVGTMLIIVCNLEISYSKLCSPLVTLGKSSYSLYLWHWPLIILILKCKYSNDVMLFSVIITAVAIISYLSYKYLENSKFINNILVNHHLYVFVYVFVLSVALYISHNEGTNYLSKFMNNEIKIMVKDGPKLPERYTPHTVISLNNVSVEQMGDQYSKPHIFFAGDSHLEHFVYFLKNINKTPVYVLYMRGILAYGDEFANLKAKIIMGPEERKTFYALYTEMLSKLEDGDTVVLSNRWDGYSMFYNKEYNLEANDQNFEKFVAAMTADLQQQISKYPKLKFYILSQGITLNDKVLNCLKINLNDSFLNAFLDSNECKVSRDYQSKTRTAIDKALYDLAKANDNVTIIDRNKAIELGNDFYRIVDNNIPLFFDQNHLSSHGGEVIGNYIMHEIGASNYSQER